MKKPLIFSKEEMISVKILPVISAAQGSMSIT